MLMFCACFHCETDNGQLLMRQSDVLPLQIRNLLIAVCAEKKYSVDVYKIYTENKTRLS